MTQTSTKEWLAGLFMMSSLAVTAACDRAAPPAPAPVQAQATVADTSPPHPCAPRLGVKPWEGGSLRREPGKSFIFKPPDGNAPLQVLTYDDVFPGVRLFCSLGLFHYAASVGRRVEIVAPGDAGWEDLPEVLAFTLFYLVSTRTPIVRGLAVRPHYELIKPEFVNRFRKPAVYIKHPYGFPETFAQAATDAHVFMLFFLSDEEYEFCIGEGAQAFEELFAAKRVDPMALARPCVFDLPADG
jgi:hypothetical protein